MWYKTLAKACAAGAGRRLTGPIKQEIEGGNPLNKDTSLPEQPLRWDRRSLGYSLEQSEESGYAHIRF